MAWEWLDLTPEALRSLNADPTPLLTALLCLITLVFLSALVWYIHYVTDKDQIKPPNQKKKPNFIVGMRFRGELADKRDHDPLPVRLFFYNSLHHKLSVRPLPIRTSTSRACDFDFHRLHPNVVNIW
ncbi:hypothetical protein BDV96DRAFT_642200 [Lophiotrema nucula]|uniref:Uncharacterized protein n=1 Tax=Lophiotrema nucula TaxID=690887 RepID=A0A6A5ZND6_9PLEO|nr:hypothetical protein BDV96DRAFT_642200 [Lophiotrema nucula]